MEKIRQGSERLAEEDVALLSNSSIPEGIRTTIANKLLSQQAERMSLALERKKILWNTPVAASMAALLTLTATFFFDRIMSQVSTENTMSLEELRTELSASEARLAQSLQEQTSKTEAEIASAAKEREFQYEIVRLELQNKNKTYVERAQVLLFLSRAGVLSSLNHEELEKMAQEQIENPEEQIIPRLSVASEIATQCPPPAYRIPPLEASVEVSNRAMLLAAIAENNAGITESCAPNRVSEYLASVGVKAAPQETQWGAAFTAWLSTNFGDRNETLAQATVRDQWLAALEANITFEPMELDPMPGDIIYVLTRNFAEPMNAVEVRDPGGPIWAGMTGIILSVNQDIIEFIAGNVGGAVRVTYVPRKSSRIVGFVRI